MRILALLLLTFLLAPSPVAAAPQIMLGSGPEQDVNDEIDDVFLDEVRDDFARKVQDRIKHKRWQALFHLYRTVLDNDEKRLKVMRLGTDPKQVRYTSVVAYLNSVISKLPAEALRDYRFRYDDEARELFRKARTANDMRMLEAVVERHFFSSYADEATLRLATRLVETGRAEDASYHLERLLRYYPDLDPSIPRSLIAARLVHALKLSGNTEQLKKISAWLAEQEWNDQVFVGSERIDAAAYALAAAEAPIVTVERPPSRLPPAIYDKVQLSRIVDAYIRNEIRLLTYTFNEEDETSSSSSNTSRRRRPPGGNVRMPGTEKDFPLMPAYARYGAREVIVATNGAKVAAIDPRSGRTYWVLGSGKPKTAATGVNRRFYGAQATGNMTPIMGVTIKGEYAYITMQSRVSGTVKRTPNPWGYQVNYPLAARILCVRLYDARRDRITRDVVWDTDRYYSEVSLSHRIGEEPSNDWTFCSPPLVRGDRLYVGVVGTPGNDSASYVACFDRANGRMLWRTFISQVSGRFGAAMRGRFMSVLPLTLLTQGNGMIYATTHAGSIAALNPVNGNILWATLYRTQSPKTGQQFSRPPSYPVLHRGRLYVLAQDSPKLLLLDAMDGTRLDVPKIKRPYSPLGSRGSGTGNWKNYSRLIGVVDDHVVLMGKGQSLVIDPVRKRTFDMYNPSNFWSGSGCIDGSFIYLPIQEEDRWKMAVFEAGSWKYRYSEAWDDAKEAGNIVRGGPYVMVMSRDRLAVYTDSRVIRAWYAPLMVQDPPDLEALYTYGMMMRGNGIWDEAAGALLRYLGASEGLASESSRRQKTQRDLSYTFLRRGDGAMGMENWNVAARMYERALAFSEEPGAIAECSLKLGRAYEKLGRSRDAVQRYHALRKEHPDVVWPSDDGEIEESLWTLTTRRIERLIDTVGADVYEEIEKEVVKALKKVGRDDVRSLEDLFERFPNSRMLRKRIEETLDSVLESDRWREAERMLRRLRHVDPKAFSRDLRRKLIEALERNKAYDRAREELRKLKGLFGDEPIGQESVKDYVDRKLAELAARRSTPAVDPNVKTLGRVGVWDDPVVTASVPPKQKIAVDRSPLSVSGFAPPGFSADHEFFRTGSAVELWNVTTADGIWSRGHPGGRLGLSLAARSDGLVVIDVLKSGPGKRAGLKRNDVILTLDGGPATADRLARVVRFGRPGDRVELGVQRTKGKIEDLRVELAGRPANAWPGIVAAAFGAHGSLLTAWQDHLAALDWKSGRVRWSWRVPAAGADIVQLAWADGRAYVLTHFVEAKDRKDVEISVAAAQPAPASKYRLYCVDDLSGTLLWSRVLAPAGSYVLFADVGWDSVVVRSSGSGAPITQAGQYERQQLMVFSSGLRQRPTRANVAAGNHLIVLDGHTGARRGKKIDLGQVAAFRLDLSAKRCVWIKRVSNNGQLHVRGLWVESYEPEPKLKANKGLTGKYGVVNNAQVRLALWKDRIAVIAAPLPNPKLWVFEVKDRKIVDVKQLKLDPKNDLARNLKPPIQAAVDAAGTLYVYTFEKGMDPASQNDAIGYVDFFRLDGAATESVGRAYVPGLTKSPAEMDVSLSPFLIFIAPKSRGGHLGGQANRIDLYNVSPAKGGRWIAPEFTKVDYRGNSLAAWVQRDRLYFRRGKTKLYAYARTTEEPKEEEKEEGMLPDPKEPQQPRTGEQQRLVQLKLKQMELRAALEVELIRAVEAARAADP